MAASGGAAVAQRAREVAAEVEKGGARHVALEPAALTRRGVGQREAAVDHDQVPLAQMRAQPVHGHQWAERFAHERRASRPLGAGAHPRGRSRAAARLRAAEALQRRRDGSPGGRAERHSAVACIDLDMLVSRGIQASAPVDDSVTARIDGHEADVGAEGPGELLPEAGTAVALEAGALEESRRAERAEPSDGLDLQPHEWMDRQRLDVRRAQRDDPADQIGAAVSEHLGEAPASALTDDRRAPALF